MNVYYAEAQAIELMDMWGLIDKGWTLEFENRTSRMGACKTSERIIKLSTPHIEKDDDHVIIDTVKHEIAHALHYEWYVDRGMEHLMRERIRRGKRWVRKIPPHGKEWKKFAAKVGCDPSARAQSKVSLTTQKLWTMVLCVDNEVEFIYQYGKFLSNLKHRFIKNRKAESLGNLYMTYTDWYNDFKSGKMNTLSLYQRNPRQGYVFEKVVTQ